MKKNENSSYRQDVLELAKEKYGTEPEYLWRRYPDYAVLRHGDNQKWYGVIMSVAKEKLGMTGGEKADILNIKCDPLMSGSLLMEEGIIPAYHMNKGNWLSVMLDGSVDREKVFSLLHMSYELTKSSKAKQRGRTVPKEWLVPANPRYYDVEQAFSENDTILWKQSGNIIIGDTIFLYMAAPVSAVMYQCTAVEVDIPYSYDSDELHIHKAMKIKLCHRFEKEQLTFQKLNEFGVFAVRGPRSVPNSLSSEIKRIILSNKRI